MKHKLFGEQLRKLRQDKPLGIKELAPELDVTYTHLSNIELGYKKPSVDFIDRMAKFFGLDKEKKEYLMILAGYIPDDISEILLEHPGEAPQYLRSRFPKEEDKQ